MNSALDSNSVGMSDTYTNQSDDDDDDFISFDWAESYTYLSG